MFITLLISTFLIAAVVSFIVSVMFRKSISKILSRIIKDEISSAWERYLRFAIIVVGISGGVRIWDLEKYISDNTRERHYILNSERWVLEIYRTIIDTMQSLAWLLLVFFLIALIAYVVVKGQESRKEKLS